jgi:hypothetical protein
MSFNLPTVFSKKIENPRKYELLLNKLAGAGYDSPDKLRINPEKVIKVIEELVGTGADEKSKHKKRYYVSAILWVMTDEYVKTANPYYKYYQTILPAKNDKTGADWEPRKTYTPE